MKILILNGNEDGWRTLNKGEKNKNYCYWKLPSEGNKDVLASLLRDAPMMVNYKYYLFYTSVKAKTEKPIRIQHIFTPRIFNQTSLYTWATW